MGIWRKKTMNKIKKKFFNFINIVKFTDQWAILPVVGIIKRTNFASEFFRGDVTNWEYEYRLAFEWLHYGISIRLFRKREE